MEKKTWEVEFDEKFPKVESYCEEHKGYCPSDDAQEIKSFIRNLLMDEVKRVLDEICIDCAFDLPEEMLKGKSIDWQYGWEEATAEYQEKIEEIKEKL